MTIYAGYSYNELVSLEMKEQLLPRLNGTSVLALGIGGGHPVAPLAFGGMDIFGVDIDSNRLNFCSDAFKEAGMEKQLTLLCSDAVIFLDHNLRKFNLVFLTDFLMFFTKTESRKIIKKSYETLESSGLLWIVTLSTSTDFYINLSSFQEEIEPETYIDHSHCGGAIPVCFFKPGEIEDYLNSLGAVVLFGAERENRNGDIVNVVLAQKLSKQ